MGFSIMLWDAEKLVPAEYWCPYGTQLNIYSLLNIKDKIILARAETNALVM